MAWGKKEDGAGFCKLNKKDGEIICHRKIGDSEATIYGKLGKDGVFRIGDHDYRGSRGQELFIELEEEMLERTKHMRASVEQQQ